MEKIVYVGIVPDIFGYGMNVLGDTEQECVKALKKQFFDWRVKYNMHGMSFDRMMEYFGGQVFAVEKGTVYLDDFKN